MAVTSKLAIYFWFSLRCDHCETYKYGFSLEGCKSCDCDRIGSKDLQCDSSGQCHCLDNVEGRRCDRCKENKYDRQRGCVDCPHCYNLVQDAVNYHREQLDKLNDILDEIERNPTVIDDETFELKLHIIQNDIEQLYEQAKEALGGDEVAVVQKLDDIKNRQKGISRILSEIEENILSATNKGNQAEENTLSSSEILKEAETQLDEAVALLEIEGKVALEKANLKAKEYGQQSDKMTNIAQESRHLADELDNQVQTLTKVASEAKNVSSAAYDLAKNTTDQQLNITLEIRRLRGELANKENKLNSVKEWISGVHDRAKKAKDDALTLVAEINNLVVPDIDVPKLKEKADEIKKSALGLMNETENIRIQNEDLLNEINEQLLVGEDLLQRGEEQQVDLADLLADIDLAKVQAENAVELGDKTLEEAKDTYETLSRKFIILLPLKTNIR